MTQSKRLVPAISSGGATLTQATQDRCSSVTADSVEIADDERQAVTEPQAERALGRVKAFVSAVEFWRGKAMSTEQAALSLRIHVHSWLLPSWGRRYVASIPLRRSQCAGVSTTRSKSSSWQRRISTTRMRLWTWWSTDYWIFRWTSTGRCTCWPFTRRNVSHRPWQRSAALRSRIARRVTRTPQPRSRNLSIRKDAAFPAIDPAPAKAGQGSHRQAQTKPAQALGQ